MEYIIGLAIIAIGLVMWNTRKKNQHVAETVFTFTDSTKPVEEVKPVETPAPAPVVETPAPVVETLAKKKPAAKKAPVAKKTPAVKKAPAKPRTKKTTAK